MRIFQAFIFFIAASAAGAQTASGHIALGDRDYAARAAEFALDHYEKAIASDPRNHEALWKASRSAVDIGSYGADATRQKTLFANAEQYARRAIAVNPGNAEGHFSLSRALGKTALTQSPRGRVKYAVEIQSRALDCLKIDPGHAGCLHVMGMWNAEVMRLNSITRAVAKNLLGGRVFGSASWKEAVRYMVASVAAEPDRIVHRVDLAEIHADMGNTAQARAEWETALRLPETDVNDPLYKARARKALGTR